MQKSFGPAGSETDGVVRLSCVTRSTYCFLLRGNMCSDQRPPREIPDPSNTPDWCKYAKGIREDIVMMEDFRELGLDDMTRAELSPLMREIPKDRWQQWKGRPFPLREHNAEMMRAVIRRDRIAGGWKPKREHPHA